MIATSETIIDFIPQRAPFVLIDNLLEATAENTLSSFEIKENTYFLVDGKLTTAGLLENMAQTAAAGVGYKCSQKKIEVPVGFIGAIKDFQLMEEPKIGQLITTKVTVQNEVFGASIVLGEIFLADKKIASAELKIFLQTEK